MTVVNPFAFEGTNANLPPNERRAIMIFGRFQPPTKAHMRMIDLMQLQQGAIGADEFVFVSPTVDNDRNPMSMQERIVFLKFHAKRSTGIMGDSSLKSPWEALQWLASMGYTHIYMMAGNDRLKKYHDFRNYINHPDPTKNLPGVKEITLWSTGNRDPDAEGMEGVSATGARLAAKEGRYYDFSDMVADCDVYDRRALYTSVRRGLGINEITERVTTKSRDS